MENTYVSEKSYTMYDFSGANKRFLEICVVDFRYVSCLKIFMII